MAESATIQFLGAAGTVTGSKHLVTVGGRRVLLDCGIFQGLKKLRLRNWDPFPIPPREIDAVVLSHAHIDHIGYLPVLVKLGFHGPIHCTSATAELTRLLLRDSGHLQEEQADFANRHRTSKHEPALPLYATDDVEETLKLLQEHPFVESFEATPGIRVNYRTTGHLLGSASVDLHVDSTQLVFSGDVGRWSRPILRDPALLIEADVLLLESTYGDRIHPPDARSELARIVNEAAARGGPLIIPAFAVGRAQEVLWDLRILEEESKIPVLPVYLDSPMSVDATEIYLRHPEDHDLDMAALKSAQPPIRPFRVRYTRTSEQSKALNREKEPFIVIAASGMATGGRVLHHLKLRLPDPRTTVLLAGFQAVGTRGRMLQEGAQSLRIYGETVPVRAKIEHMSGLSSHGDQEELLRWLSGFKKPPRQTYLVHGEPQASEALSQAIRERYGWNVRPAKDQEIVALA